MTRLIDADALEQILSNNITDDRGGYLTMQEVVNNEAIVDTMQLIHEQPTIDTVPVKHGKWKWLSCTYDRVPCEKEYLCSECQHKTVTHGDGLPWEKYCPNCGARMDEE